ncbi:MAG TPA: hypothetical protein VFI14_01075, partial [Chryseosolibacter sp.]|nr:hypothetical protein [Chryseosolibacter sp.]
MNRRRFKAGSIIAETHSRAENVGLPKLNFNSACRMFCLTPFRLLAFNAVYTFALTNAISQVDERPMVLEV